MKPIIPHAFTLCLTLSAMLLAQSPLRASEMDGKIEAAAKNSYVFKTFLVDDAIKTESKDGAVTLTGNVSEDSHKQLAQDTVAGLPGVTSVNNMIEVKASPPANSDTWLYMKVKSTLAFHRSVSAYNTKVELKEGVVTLTGEAASQAQKDLTAEYAKDVAGIKDVKNEMTVAATTTKPKETWAELIDDASITAQVRMALLTHRSTNAFKTTVTTTEGVVTVGGAAKNAAQKDLVTKLVTDINGVKSVVNNMTVETAVTTN
ncbi:MAG: BON domain-containing protein [Prosthecobacter sp.]|uniref:BON domain-containing protein n=1 Tax=Prosthecobacter sp. TaxID=1965333 RepID=UPI0038FF0250